MSRRRAKRAALAGALLCACAVGVHLPAGRAVAEESAPAPVARSAGEGASDEVASRLLERAFANLYADDYVQTLELTTRAGDMRPLTRTLQVTRKQSVRPGKALVRFLEPFDVRRTSVLILENDGSTDDLFVYLPALGLTRRISAAQRADSFFGTDLSFEDVEPKRAEEYEARWVHADAEGSACVPVEVRPRAGFTSTYDSMLSCIERERAVIVWTEFRRDGHIVKRLEIDPSSVRTIGERAIPFLMTMRTLRTGSETQVRTQSYELVGELPERLFSTWNLQAGDAERDRSHAGAGSSDGE